jgi:hypothetical protein
MAAERWTPQPEEIELPELRRTGSQRSLNTLESQVPLVRTPSPVYLQPESIEEMNPRPQNQNPEQTQAGNRTTTASNRHLALNNLTRSEKCGLLALCCIPFAVIGASIIGWKVSDR